MKLITSNPFVKQKLTLMIQRSMIGTKGYLAILLWSVGIMIFASLEWLWLAGLMSLLIAVLLYPQSFRRLLHWRWLIILGTLVIINGLWVGETDRMLWRIPYSMRGLLEGLQMAGRAIVILVAVDGFSSKVSITEIASLFERIGLSGLGFSLGIAFNLLPILREVSTNVWRTLRMRGGLRQQRWRGLKLLLVTILSNALRHAEDISLAAESRAYSPERSQAPALKSGFLDGWLWVITLVSVISFLMIR